MQSNSNNHIFLFIVKMPSCQDITYKPNVENLSSILLLTGIGYYAMKKKTTHKGMITQETYFLITMIMASAALRALGAKMDDQCTILSSAIAPRLLVIIFCSYVLMSSCIAVYEDEDDQKK